MKRTVLYNWTDDDPPFVKMIGEARTRVQELCYELREDTPEHKAFNKLGTGNQFTKEDLTLMRQYSERILERIRQKWGNGSELATHYPELGASVIQAGENYRDVMAEAERYFLEDA